MTASTAQATKTDRPKKDKSFDVFTIINDLSFGKQDLLHDSVSGDVDTDNTKVYCPTVVNRAFSLHIDTLLDAQLMNESYKLPPDVQHDYYLFEVQKGRRFGKWFKTSADPMDKVISEVYDVNAAVAKQYRSVMSQAQLDDITKMQNSQSEGRA